MQPFILLSGSPPSDPFRSLKKATRFNMSERGTPVLGSSSMAVPSSFLKAWAYCRSNGLKDQRGSDSITRRRAVARSRSLLHLHLDKADGFEIKPIVGVRFRKYGFH